MIGQAESRRRDRRFAVSGFRGLEYEVNGRTSLEWFIDRNRIARDHHRGIENDRNAWLDGPRDLIAAFRRIVARLPIPFPDTVGHLAESTGEP